MQLRTVVKSLNKKRGVFAENAFEWDLIFVPKKIPPVVFITDLRYRWDIPIIIIVKRW